MLHYVKFLTGTFNEYQLLKHKEDDTLYFIYEPDENQATLYLGERLISDGHIDNNTMATLASLKDVSINNELKHSDVLAYDNILQCWTNKNYLNIINNFIGTNGISSGIAGLVPAPLPEQENTFLKSNGTWSSLDDIISTLLSKNLNQASIPIEDLNNILI